VLDEDDHFLLAVDVGEGKNSKSLDYGQPVERGSVPVVRNPFPRAKRSEGCEFNKLVTPRSIVRNPSI
jgi:hypothetical protein